MSKRYKNSPIIEVLCEFRFEPSSPWDLTVPGLVYDRIRESFPKRQQVEMLGVGVAFDSEGVKQQVAKADLMQFLSDDEKALVQVGPNLLAVNHLKPYPGWQDFLPIIRQGFDGYVGVAEPKSIQHVALRYINHIEIPSWVTHVKTAQNIKLENYFEFRPFVGSNLPQDFGPFIVGMQVPYENSRDALRIHMESVAAEASGMAAVMLELNYSLVQPGQMAMDAAFEWAEIAHGHIGRAFEACITDRLRQIFEEV